MTDVNALAHKLSDEMFEDARTLMRQPLGVVRQCGELLMTHAQQVRTLEDSWLRNIRQNVELEARLNAQAVA